MGKKETAGFIKLYRAMRDWRHYKNPFAFRLFVHLLLTVEWEEKEINGTILQPGETLTSLRKLADETGLTVSQVRAAQKALTKTHEISTKTAQNKTVIAIEKWGFYQGAPEKSAQKSHENSTGKRTESNKPTSYKEGEETIRREEATPYGEFENVFLTPSEFEKLTASMPTQYTDYIENLSLYMKRTGKTYQNHYLTILAWKRRDEQRTKEENKHKSVSFLDLI